MGDLLGHGDRSGSERLVGGVALAAIVAVLLSWSGLRSSAEPGTSALEDIDIVADSENLDMLEDVEFYMWLDDAAPDDHTG